MRIRVGKLELAPKASMFECREERLLSIRTVGTLFSWFSSIFMFYGHRIRYLLW
jgi:hypothetical protein